MTEENNNDDDGAAPEPLFDGVEEPAGEISDTGDGWLSELLQVEERPRGLLSHTDREFLVGLKDYKHEQSEANRRQDIRERVAHGLRDFLLLWWLMDDQELVKVFADLHEKQDLNDSLGATLAFMYRGLDRDEVRLERIVEEGVYAADNMDKKGRWAGDTDSVDVTIDIERNPDLNAIYDRFRHGDSAQLTPTEIGILVRAGKIESDELGELEAEKPVFPGVYFGGGLDSVIEHESEEGEVDPEE